MTKPRKEKWQYKLSSSQLHVLHNLCTGQEPDAHLSGASQHGAYGQTLASLKRKGLIRSKFSYLEKEKITLNGIKVHRHQCCKKGRTEEDEVIDIVDRSLGVNNGEGL